MEEQEENKKVTLLDQLSIAVSSPKNYKQLVKLKTGRLVWFVVIISFLLAFIEFGIDAIFWVGKVGGLRNLITNKIPAFTYHDNKLDMEHDMQLEIGMLLCTSTRRMRQWTLTPWKRMECTSP